MQASDHTSFAKKFPPRPKSKREQSGRNRGRAPNEGLLVLQFERQTIALNNRAFHPSISGYSGSPQPPAPG